MFKICHVTSAHNPEDVRIFKKECISLSQKKDYNVYVVGAGEDRFEKNGINIVGAGKRPLRRLDRMLKFAPQVVDKALEINADLYHLHDPELLRYALKFKRLGKKVIFDSHENIMESIDEKVYLPWVLRKCVKVYYNYVQTKVLKEIDGIVVVTPQMIESYKKLNKNVSLVANFPVISMDKVDQPLQSEKGRFIFAGGISEQWSHREIINAINNVADAEYFLYGDGEASYIEMLKCLEGWKKVHFGGKISFEEVQREIDKSQFAFAILKPGKNTFYKEGTLGNTKLFEAMEKGKPIIATDFRLWRDIIEHYQCGICVDPTKPEEIESAMKYLLNCSAEQIEDMGRNGIRAIHEKYNWNVCAGELNALYDKVLRNN